MVVIDIKHASIRYLPPTISLFYACMHCVTVVFDIQAYDIYAIWYTYVCMLYNRKRARCMHLRYKSMYRYIYLHITFHKWCRYSTLTATMNDWAVSTPWTLVKRCKSAANVLRMYHFSPNRCWIVEIYMRAARYECNLQDLSLNRRISSRVRPRTGACNADTVNGGAIDRIPKWIWKLGKSLKMFLFRRIWSSCSRIFIQQLI